MCPSVMCNLCVSCLFICFLFQVFFLFLNFQLVFKVYLRDLCFQLVKWERQFWTYIGLSAGGFKNTEQNKSSTKHSQLHGGKLLSKFMVYIVIISITLVNSKNTYYAQLLNCIERLN